MRVRGGGVVHAVVDDEDDHLARRSWRLRKGYAVTREYAGTRHAVPVYHERSMHRMILGLLSGDSRESDHINRNRLDNRRVNLRVVNRRENAQNRGPYATNSAGFRGVLYQPQVSRRRPFRAVAGLNGRQYLLGRYNTAEEAAEVARRWREQHMTHAVDGGMGGQIPAVPAIDRVPSKRHARSANHQNQHFGGFAHR